MFRKVNKVHFVGIGGIGMSGIAELLLNLGFDISGSDVSDSEIIDKLRSNGAKISIGHKSDNLFETEVVVYSSAIPEDNVELIFAPIAPLFPTPETTTFPLQFIIVSTALSKNFGKLFFSFFKESISICSDFFPIFKIFFFFINGPKCHQ